MPVLQIAVAALAMVLVVSGVLKVRDPDATAPMLRAIGLPDARVAVYALAATEIVVGAAALVIGGTVAMLVLAGLYAAFAVVSLVILRSGDDVSCGCFGRRSAAMTPVHVGVNAGAAVIAVAGALLGTTSLLGADASRSAAVVAVALVAAMLLAAVVVALLTIGPARLVPGRRNGASRSAPAALALDLEESGAGSGATSLAPVVGRTTADEVVTIELAGTGRITLLAFLTTGCTTCTRFWDTFAVEGGVALPGDRTDLVIVTRGDDEENPNRVRDLAPADHPVVRSSEAWRSYGVTAGPYFVLVDGSRDIVLGEGTATAWTDVESLVAGAVRAGGPPPDPAAVNPVAE